MMKFNISHCLLSLSGIAACTTGFAAPLECTQATAPIETTICNVPALKEIHQVMEQLYTTALGELKNKSLLALITQTQEKWLAKRAECAQSEQDKTADCLVNAYQERAEVITFLNSKAFNDSDMKKIVGIYENPEQHLKMYIEAVNAQKAHVMLEGGNLANYPTSKKQNWKCTIDITDDIEKEKGEIVLRHNDVARGGFLLDFGSQKLRIADWGVMLGEYCEPNKPLDITLKKR
jgi:uncharacterized protein